MSRPSRVKVKSEIYVTKSSSKDLESNETYQLVNIYRRFAAVSEHPSDQSRATPDGTNAAAATGSGVVHVGSPNLAPNDDAATDVPRIENDTARADKAGNRRSDGRLMIMAPSRDDDFWQYKSWDEAINHPEIDAAEEKVAGAGKNRISAFAAVVALVAITGAAGGALAIGGLAHVFSGNDAKVAATQTRTVEETLARIDTELAALKLSVDRAGKQASAQINKTNERVEKVEKAQAEPLARIAKLSEAVDKLRAAPVPVPVAAVATPKEDPRDVTGSISKPPVSAPKTEVARLPTVDGWVLHEVANGGATIEGRSGIYEVYAGDPVPGLGRVDAIRRQDGRWVVVTSRGLVVGR